MLLCSYDPRSDPIPRTRPSHQWWWLSQEPPSPWWVGVGLLDLFSRWNENKFPKFMRNKYNLTTNQENLFGFPTDTWSCPYYFTPINNVYFDTSKDPSLFPHSSPIVFPTCQEFIKWGESILGKRCLLPKRLSSISTEKHSIKKPFLWQMWPDVDIHVSTFMQS